MPSSYQLGGAGAGALAGTAIMPGVGTVMGAALGYGLGGILGGDDKNKYDPAPAQYDWAHVDKARNAADAARGGQMETAEMMRRRALGLAPSVAETQLAQSRDANIQSAQSMANSARGGALAQAQAQRQASMNAATTQQQAAGQAAMLRANEQATAEQQLAALYSQTRSGDQEAAQRELSAQFGVSGDMIKQQGMEASAAQSNANREAGTIDSMLNLGSVGMAKMSDANVKTGIMSETGSKPVDYWAQIQDTSRPGDAYDPKKQYDTFQSASQGAANLEAAQKWSASPYGSPIPGLAQRNDTYPNQSAAERGGPNPVPVLERQFPNKQDEAFQTKAAEEAAKKPLMQFRTPDDPAQSAAADKGKTSHAFDGLTSGLKDGSITMSDKRSKTNVGKSSFGEFLDSIEPVSYNYKSPVDGAPGRHYGVIAQDMEQTPVGRTFVKETPRGKALDAREGFGVVLGALGEVNRRLEAIEKKRGA